MLFRLPFDAQGSALAIRIPVDRIRAKTDTKIGIVAANRATA